MTIQTQNDSAPTSPGRNSKLVAGIALIAIGVLALVAQVVKSDWLGMLFLPTLGLIFLAWGSLTRKVGLLIPGGIISGLGLGAMLVESPLGQLGDPARGGLFLLAFALGWGLITLLSALFTSQTHWWPLIPGSIMAVVGGALLVGNIAPQILTVMGSLWPLGLIILGLYLLFGRKDTQRQ